MQGFFDRTTIKVANQARVGGTEAMMGDLGTEIEPIAMPNQPSRAANLFTSLQQEMHRPTLK